VAPAERAPPLLTRDEPGRRRKPRPTFLPHETVAGHPGQCCLELTVGEWPHRFDASKAVETRTPSPIRFKYLMLEQCVAHLGVFFFSHRVS
jgi:hypothetical protein